jgi:hypothetical protein
MKKVVPKHLEHVIDLVLSYHPPAKKKKSAVSRVRKQKKKQQR